MRELGNSCFQEEEALQVRKVWNYSGSLNPLLNDILSTMKKSGWTKEMVDDECIFSRELTMDDKEDMTLSQLGTSQFGHNNDISTKDLSETYLPRKNGQPTVVRETTVACS